VRTFLSSNEIALRWLRHRYVELRSVKTLDILIFKGFQNTDSILSPAGFGLLLSRVISVWATVQYSIRN
jgi:hypothetical protein